VLNVSAPAGKRASRGVQPRRSFAPPRVQALYWTQNTSFAMTPAQLSVFTQLLVNGTLQMIAYAPAASGEGRRNMCQPCSHASHSLSPTAPTPRAQASMVPRCGI
jgi:hypothetical protein